MAGAGGPHPQGAPREQAGNPALCLPRIGAFKVSMVDVGLLGAMSDLPPEAVVAGNRVFTEYKDALFQGASVCACACSK